MAKVAFIEPERGYRALKHMMPWAVRNIRFMFDLGSTAAEIKRLYKGQNAEFVYAAVDYMAAQPMAGVIRRFDGDDRWTWADGPQSAEGT